MSSPRRRLLSTVALLASACAPGKDTAFSDGRVMETLGAFDASLYESLATTGS